MPVIRNFRKFKADGRYLSFCYLHQVLTIFRTTFFSVVFAVANSLPAPPRYFSSLFTPRHSAENGHTMYVPRPLAIDYLTSKTGVTIIFESATVPKWKDSQFFSRMFILYGD